MTTKITGYQNPPVQVGADKALPRARDTATGAANATPTGNPVRITDQARQLAALEQAVRAVPTVNEARVAEIRLAIEEGRYEVAPERIADKLLRMDRELSGTEK